MADVASVPLESILCTEEIDSRPSRSRNKDTYDHSDLMYRE
jgi:hypothetical protein